MVRLERLSVVFQNRIVNRISGFGPQVPRELSRVVHFNADGALAAPQYLKRLFRVERMDVFEVQPIDANPFSRQLLRRFLNDAFRGTPSDQSHVRVLQTFELGRRQFGQNQSHLLHALLLDLAADGRRSKDVADENSLFVMVVRCGYMQRALGPGQRPRRDAVPGKGVALEFAVPVPASHDFAALDGDLAGKGAGLDRLGMLRKQEIRDQDHGHLVFLAQVERFNSGPEAVLHIHRRDDRARIVTLGGAEYLIQIALLRLRGNAG